MKALLLISLLFCQGCTLYISIGKSVDLSMGETKIQSKVDADILPLLIDAFIAGQAYTGDLNEHPNP